MMSSTANASISGNVTSAKSNQGPTAGRPNMKTTMSGKGADGGRKQTASPAGNTQKPSQTAWGSGTNPITQRPIANSQINGSIPSRPAQQNIARESNTADQHAHDRLVFICGASIGLPVTVTTKSGDAFTGVLSNWILTANEQSVTLKMVQESTNYDTSANGIAPSTQLYLGSGADHAMTFDLRDVVIASIPNLSLTEVKNAANGASSAFRTDTDISGNKDSAERKLQRWVPDESVGPEMSLESDNTGTWDQFAVNERKFGTKTTYDENLYTTSINRSDPSYRQREAAAAKLAREIEDSTSNNAHIREERGQALETDFDDEEAKYSGVRRGKTEFPPLASGQANKYTPPARRAPTGQPTVTGAPVDPAIVSAQLSRPDPAPKQSKAENNPLSAAVPDVAVGKDTKPASSEKLSVDQASTSGKGRQANSSVSPQRKLPLAENATEGVEKKLLHQFRDFANSEKQKVQEKRRLQASHDRTAKLNELMRFSKTFKLNTPVPTDLVPILAKDPMKQEEIIEKAHKQVEEKKQPSAPATATTASPAATPEVRTPSRPAAAGRYEAGSVPTSSTNDRQNVGRGRQGYIPTGPTGNQNNRLQQGMPNRGPSGGYMNRMSAKPTIPTTIPTPIPVDGRGSANQSIGTSGFTSPSRSAIPTPTSAVSKGFNVAAIEFRPNPSASSFNPSTASVAASSPASTTRTRSASRAPSPSTFFGSRKPVPASDRPKFSSFFNPIKRLKQESEAQPAGKNYASNGGIPEPYRTQVRWDVPEANIEKTYRDMVDKPAGPVPVSPSNRSVSSTYIPHQHQLPPHMQNGGPGIAHTPPQGPHAMQAQHSHQSHFDDHRMSMSAGSHVYPSPRVGQAQMMYQSPMPGQAPMYGQPTPQYFPQGQVPMQMRAYPTTPQFVQPQAVPMMAQQSQGPYMAVPQQFNQQMPMYSPSPAQVYPAHVGQPHSGYPSPSRGAPMMMHQGSQQGHHPQGMMYVSGGHPQQGNSTFRPRT
ncbi:putative pab1 binding protein [Phaeomoniella chlamydospora]|uniref:Putative pab1 binding protein n=1 Tax=Phaeomoniella chlamydospora TaxID=158046 RepID=A0A0G2GK83_PHACM|nr:putative pab1 binding protein [Phaeomoniella chlamydospora]